MNTELIPAKLSYDPAKQKWFIDGRKMSGGLMGQVSDDLLLFLSQPRKSSKTIDVEYERTDEHPITKIRYAGKPFIERKSVDPIMKTTANDKSAEGDLSVTISDYTAENSDNSGTRQMNSYFHNPYNFIPALPRNIDHPDLGDHTPASHDRYHSELWSGRIKVKLTTHTPLLIPDASKATENKDSKHKTYPTRVDAHGDPYLPSTSIKGMLRAAYEAVTNSRLGVFGKEHEDRLAFRQEAEMGLLMVPARITEDKTNKKKYIQLLTGISQFESDGSPKKCDPKDKYSERHPMFAAWLRQYGNHNDPNRKFAPKHADKVWAYIKLWKHVRPSFYFWNVIELRNGDLPQPTDKPVETRHANPIWQKANPALPQQANWLQVREKWIQGYVCITNRNINNKHDERVFFSDNLTSIPKIEISPAIEKAWNELIKNYAVIHKSEILKQHLQRPPALKPYCTWSRHIKNEIYHPKTESELIDGNLCYARIKVNGSYTQILGLYPVMISRELHKTDPKSLLHPSLCPASQKGEFFETALCPADRVFGWANQDGKGAYRGNIRISQANIQPRKDNDTCLVNFGDSGLPLAILGQPKPQQSRFYASPDKMGSAYSQDASKLNVAYDNPDIKGLRGRKAYPHHSNRPVNYWVNQNPGSQADDSSQENLNGIFREYLRPHQIIETEITDNRGRRIQLAKLNESETAYKTTHGEGVRDSQNRSVKSWIRPKTEFYFNIEICNLSDFELGALLWILNLNQGNEDNPVFFHRLGGGKPLGCGSVSLQVLWDDGQSYLSRGKRWQSSYETFDEEKQADFTDDAEISRCTNTFKQALKLEYHVPDFTEVSFIKAFLQCCKGFNTPIHYPRVRDSRMRDDIPVPPHPEGREYLWFVANERKATGEPKHSLPELKVSGYGLPYLIEP